MLSFSEEQLRQLRLNNWDRMCARIAEHVWAGYRGHIEAQGLNEKSLQDKLRAPLIEAKKKGFSSERDLRVFAEGCAIFGLNFMQSPKFKKLQQQIDITDDGEPTARLVDEAMILAETLEIDFA